MSDSNGAGARTPFQDISNNQNLDPKELKRQRNREYYACNKDDILKRRREARDKKPGSTPMLTDQQNETNTPVSMSRGPLTQNSVIHVPQLSILHGKDSTIEYAGIQPSNGSNQPVNRPSNDTRRPAELASHGEDQNDDPYGIFEPVVEHTSLQDFLEPLHTGECAYDEPDEEPRIYMGQDVAFESFQDGRHTTREENMDEEGKDEHAENMQIEGMITKDEDVNPESSKTIEQQAIMDDTENIHINELLSKEESSGINDKDEVEKKNSTQATDCEVTQACFLFEELTFKKTSEQMHQAQDEELAQTWGTEGAETIGDKLADSNGIADKDELEENKSTQSTDSKLSEVTEELTDNETSKQMEACGDEELEQTSDKEGAEIIGDKLPMPAQTWKPIRLHNKPKKAQDYVITPAPAMIGLENIMSEPNDKRTLVSIDDSNLQRRQLERLLFPGEFLGEEIIDAYIHCISAKEHLKMRTGGSVFLENACISKLIKEFKFIRDDTLRWVLDRATTYLEHDMIYVPVNIKDFHWYLAVINTGVRRIQVLDSLGPGMNRKDLTAMVSY
ncbi:hypothetical protein D1007_58384 [Hordeum vulgare]|nr:hypothetical protein D1007_58384 [Hordeum vulgare]